MPRPEPKWPLSRKQRKLRLTAFEQLYGSNSPQNGKTSPRANIEASAAQISVPGRTENIVPRGTSKVQKTNKPRKERYEQEDIYAWTQTVQRLQGHVMMIENQGRRNVVQAAMAKRMGLLAGVSDLFIALPITPFAGLWLEVKQARDYTLSERQKDHWKRQEAFQDRMRMAGYAAETCYGFDQGREIIQAYLAGTLNRYLPPPRE